MSIANGLTEEEVYEHIKGELISGEHLLELAIEAREHCRYLVEKMEKLNNPKTSLRQKRRLQESVAWAVRIRGPPRTDIPDFYCRGTIPTHISSVKEEAVNFESVMLSLRKLEAKVSKPIL